MKGINYGRFISVYQSQDGGYELRISIVEPSGKQNEIFLVLENMSKKKGNDTLKV